MIAASSATFDVQTGLIMALAQAQLPSLLTTISCACNSHVYFCSTECALKHRLDYPGIGPEHSYLSDIGRAEYFAVTDDEALEAFQMVSRLEGIIPALETSHAFAYLKVAVVSRQRVHATVCQCWQVVLHCCCKY